MRWPAARMFADDFCRTPRKIVVDVVDVEVARRVKRQANGCADRCREGVDSGGGRAEQPIPGDGRNAPIGYPTHAIVD